MPTYQDCVENWLGSTYAKLNLDQQSALIDMAYTMGCAGLRQFVSLKANLDAGYYMSAAKSMAVRKWLFSFRFVSCCFCLFLFDLDDVQTFFFFRVRLGVNRKRHAVVSVTRTACHLATLCRGQPIVRQPSPPFVRTTAIRRQCQRLRRSATVSSRRSAVRHALRLAVRRNRSSAHEPLPRHRSALVSVVQHWPILELARKKIFWIFDFWLIFRSGPPCPKDCVVSSWSCPTCAPPCGQSQQVTCTRTVVSKFFSCWKKNTLFAFVHWVDWISCRTSWWRCLSCVVWKGFLVSCFVVVVVFFLVMPR